MVFMLVLLKQLQ